MQRGEGYAPTWLLSYWKCGQSLDQIELFLQFLPAKPILLLSYIVSYIGLGSLFFGLLIVFNGDFQAAKY